MKMLQKISKTKTDDSIVLASALQNAANRNQVANQDHFNNGENNVDW